MKISLYDTKTWPRSLGDDPEKAKTFTGVAYYHSEETNSIERVYFKDGRFSFGSDEFDMSRSNEPLFRGYINSIYWSYQDADISGQLGNIWSALRILEDYKVELSIGT